MAVDALVEACATSKSIQEIFWAMTIDGKKLEKSLWGVLTRGHGQPGPFPISETPKFKKIRCLEIADPAGLELQDRSGMDIE